MYMNDVSLLTNSSDIMEVRSFQEGYLMGIWKWNSNLIEKK